MPMGISAYICLESALMTGTPSISAMRSVTSVFPTAVGPVTTNSVCMSVAKAYLMMPRCDDCTNCMMYSTSLVMGSSCLMASMPSCLTVFE